MDFFIISAVWDWEFMRKNIKLVEDHLGGVENVIRFCLCLMLAPLSSIDSPPLLSWPIVWCGRWNGSVNKRNKEINHHYCLLISAFCVYVYPFPCVGFSWVIIWDESYTWAFYSFLWGNLSLSSFWHNLKGSQVFLKEEVRPRSGCPLSSCVWWMEQLRSIVEW